MRSLRWLVAMVVVLALGTAARAQVDREDDERPRRSAPIPAAGFWPTERMMELTIDRITDEWSKSFDFDEDQLYNTRELFKERVIPWLQENRGTLQQLGIEVAEMALEKRPPTPDEMQRWSRQLLPLTEEFFGVVKQTGEEMNSFLTEDQRAMLKGHIAAMDVGTKMVLGKLDGWANGGFDAQRDWPGSQGYDEKTNQDLIDLQSGQEKAFVDATGKPVPEGALPNAKGVSPVAQAEPTPVKTPKSAAQDEWDKYVADFVARYQLNDDQKAAANKILKSEKDRRTEYLARRADDLARIERYMTAAKTEQEKVRAGESLAKFQVPVDTMFVRLKERLNKLPTSAQRQAVAQRDTDNSAAVKTGK